MKLLLPGKPTISLFENASVGIGEKGECIMVAWE